MTAFRLTIPLLCLLLLSSLTGCRQDNAASGPSAPAIQAVDMSQPVAPAPIPSPLAIAGAGNEWISFAIQVQNLPGPDQGRGLRLRLQPPQLAMMSDSIPVANFRAFQAVPMPVDLNRAGYIRHTGSSALAGELPRALLPLPMDRGSIDLSLLRDPRHPTDPQSHATAAGLIWIDLYIPATARPGAYWASCDLLRPGAAHPLASVPINLTVHDFVLPAQRHLLMVSQLNWESLQRLYPGQFEAITPRLLNRRDPAYAAPVKILDQLMNLAQEHRTQLVIPRLQPTVKWPPAAGPQVDWSDFDSLLTPWMNGKAFADGIGLGYWPAPAIDHLDNLDPAGQRDYWHAVADHFSQAGWLERSAVFMNQSGGITASPLQRLEISFAAAQILAAHPRLRVTIPLEDDQLQFAGDANPGLLDPKSTTRLVTASPGIVFASPMSAWPDDLAKPTHWLRTDLPGLIPYAEAGANEPDVRVWAWLAYLRQADLVLWNASLPTLANPALAADPGEVVWFYPGNWFGLDEPVPTLQLKWLRRAQQDYEYLLLANQRGGQADAQLIARLVTRQVQILPTQSPDPTYDLLCGATEPRVFNEARDLLASSIEARPPALPGQPPNDARLHALNHEIIRWRQPEERPFLLPRSTQWLWDNFANARGGNWISLRLGIDVYNAGDTRPDRNILEWGSAGSGWEFFPQPLIIAGLPTYWVHRFNLDARFDLDKLADDSNFPLQITFTDGYTKNKYSTYALLPIATCDRRAAAVVLDGNLADWDKSDLIHNGPLVKMVDRPSLFSRPIRPAATGSRIYSAWTADNFYVAFQVSGLAASDIHSVRNFVDYQFRRAWGEDLCELLVQPIYDDNTLGPVTHIVCKPSGPWVERKRDVKTSADPWAPLEGAAVRYASSLAGGSWSGELAIPWRVLNDDKHGRPRLLRFNFTQHQAATGESASWAGPVDFGRDEAFTGLLFLRDVPTPGTK